MSSYRCSLCGVNWPCNSKLYSPCPECGEKTAYMSNAAPLSDKEAKSRKTHADFERWLDAKRRTELEELERIPTVDKAEAA